MLFTIGNFAKDIANETTALTIIYVMHRLGSLCPDGYRYADNF